MIFYYHQLTTTEERIVYRDLKDAVENHTEQICVYNINLSGSQISQVFSYMLLDYPDYFWTKGDCSIYNEYTGDNLRTYINIVYLWDKEVCNKLSCELQNALGNICDYIDAGKNSGDKIRLISDWFYQNVQYSATEGVDQTIYAALVLRKGVCMGISKAVTLILRLYGIESITVLGSLFKKNVHAWNMVLVDGKWKHIDITIGYECFDAVLLTHGIRYKRPSEPVDIETLEKTHEPRKGIIYPMA